MRRMHKRLPEQHSWLSRALRGHCAYFGVSGSDYCLHRFLTQADRAWHDTTSL
jgi:hypothetical protein